MLLCNAIGKITYSCLPFGGAGCEVPPVAAVFCPQPLGPCVKQGIARLVDPLCADVKSYLCFGKSKAHGERCQQSPLFIAPSGLHAPRIDSQRAAKPLAPVDGNLRVMFDAPSLFSRVSQTLQSNISLTGAVGRIKLIAKPSS
jgi:hypothetical protein